MALRTTTYASLTLEGIAADQGKRAGDRLPEFVYLVLYHGEAPWSAPTRVTDLFEHSDPGRYHLVSWGGATGEGQSRDDLVALVLGLARNLSAEEMTVQLSALRSAVVAHGEESLDAFMVERMATMLALRDYPEVLIGMRRNQQLRSLDELVQKGARQGQALVLRRQVARTFGEGTARQLSKLLDELSGLDSIDRVTDALMECRTGEEFIQRLRVT